MFVQLDINTVAAGGGSRLFFRSGMFVVGPESAGADPGPTSYRKGTCSLDWPRSQHYLCARTQTGQKVNFLIGLSMSAQVKPRNEGTLDKHV